MKQVGNSDPFKALFNELPKEKTSEQFLSSVTNKAYTIQKLQKKKNFWMSIFLPVAGILTVVAIASLLLYFMDNQLDVHARSLVSVFTPLFALENYPDLFLYGLAILLLLMFDSLFRRHIQKKKEL